MLLSNVICFKLSDEDIIKINESFFYKDIKSKFKIVLIIYRQGNFKVRFPTVL